MINLRLIIAVRMHQRILHKPEVCMKNILQSWNDEDDSATLFFSLVMVHLR